VSAAVVITTPAIKCPHCALVQFHTERNACRRCKRELVPTEPVTVEETAPVPAVPEQVESSASSFSPATVVTLRQLCGLSQRQLAARMNCPRTYISKIENGKAVPTLHSLDRIAHALGVTSAQILGGDAVTALAMKDPFLRQIRELTAGMNPAQRDQLLIVMKSWIHHR